MTESKTADNTGFASGELPPFRASRGRQCKLGAFPQKQDKLCFYLSSVLVDSFPDELGQVVLLCLSDAVRNGNPPERKARNR